ncbi:MAG: hypothetical protein K8J08_16730 [Thermoanaerobaculia bacterium]|nr:hypothetical protein [Thermoanaerobaculia bacterium]
MPDQLATEFGYEMRPDEDLLNRVGYEYLNETQFDSAVEVFELAVALNPESPNAYDSLAAGLAEAGRGRESLAMARKACELARQSEDPRLEDFQSHLTFLRRELLQERIRSSAEESD